MVYARILAIGGHLGILCRAPAAGNVTGGKLTHGANYLTSAGLAESGWRLCLRGRASPSAAYHGEASLPSRGQPDNTPLPLGTLFAGLTAHESHGSRRRACEGPPLPRGSYPGTDRSGT